MVKLDRCVQWLEKAVIVVAFIAMAIVAFAQVLARFVFNNPISWSEEVARFLFVWITLIGAGHAVAYSKHFAVDFLYCRLSPRLQRIAGHVILGCIALFALLMVGYGGYVANFTKFQVSPALLLPMTYPYLCIPLSGVFILVHILRIQISGPETPAAVQEEEGGFVE